MTSPTIAPITPADVAPTIAHRAGKGKLCSRAAIVLTASCTASFWPTLSGMTWLRMPILNRCGLCSWLGRQVVGNLDAEGSCRQQEFGWQVLAVARRWLGTTTSTTEPRDSDELTPRVVADVVAHALESRGAETPRPDVGIAVVGAGAQFPGDAETVGRSCRHVGQAQAGGELRAERLSDRDPRSTPWR